MKNLSVSEAAYIAGFVDGEGTISIWRERRPANRSGFRFKAVVHLFNTDRSVLQWIRDTVDAGYIVCKNPERVGRGHKLCYVLIFGANQIRELLPQLLPYLKIKQAHAKVVLEFVGQVSAGKRQEHNRLEPLWQITHDLNQRGIASGSSGSS